MPLVNNEGHSTLQTTNMHVTDDHTRLAKACRHAYRETYAMDDQHAANNAKWAEFPHARTMMKKQQPRGNAETCFEALSGLS